MNSTCIYNYMIFQVVDLLLNGSSAASWAVGVNPLNKMGFTALDVFFLSQSEAGDREIEDILRQAGALKATDVVGVPIRSCNSNRQHGEVMSRKHSLMTCRANSFIQKILF